MITDMICIAGGKSNPFYSVEIAASDRKIG